MSDNHRDEVDDHRDNLRAVIQKVYLVDTSVVINEPNIVMMTKNRGYKRDPKHHSKEDQKMKKRVCDVRRAMKTKGESREQLP